MIAQILKQISLCAAELKLEIYLVGGFIRDTLLARTSQDLDIIVSDRAIDLAQAVRDKLAISSIELKVHQRFGTAKLSNFDTKSQQLEVDFVSMRRESYEFPGALPCVKPGTLEQDLARRDFTINALACRVTDFSEWLEQRGSFDALKVRLIDQHQGLRDLAHRSVRVLHKDSFIEDPTRIFRAARYQNRIRGTIEGETLELLRLAIEQSCLKTISTDRARNELKHIAHEPGCGDIIKALDHFKVLTAMGIGSQRCISLVERSYSLEAIFELSDKERENVLLILLMLDLTSAQRLERMTSFGFSKRTISELEKALSGVQVPTSPALNFIVQLLSSTAS